MRNEVKSRSAGKKVLICGLVVLGLSSWVRAEVVISELINTPGAKTLNYGTYQADFRVYNQGSLLMKLCFGVFEEINLGMWLNLENVIGRESITPRRPNLFVKWKIYGGKGYIPAIAVGYDAQGHGLFDKGKDEYTQPEKGLFLVIDEPLPGEILKLTLGINAYKFKDFVFKNDLHGFLGLSAVFGEKFFVLLEGHQPERNSARIGANLGAGYKITPSLGIELDVEDVGSAGWERILRFSYEGAF